MAQIRIALAQVNPTVGDIAGNSDIAFSAAQDAAAAGAQLLALPEMLIPGYPIEDLALRASFSKACMTATEELAERLQDAGLGELAVVVGTLESSENTNTPLGTPRNEPRNAAWVLQHGAVQAKYAKHHLPNYGVFDEYRYFIPGQESCTIEVAGAKVALAICEDLWQSGGPVAEARNSNADLLLVINGSPFELAKNDERLDLCARRAAEADCLLAYVNLVGGQDELVFDGDSMVVSPAGVALARAESFTPALLVADLDTDQNTASVAESGTGSATTAPDLAHPTAAIYQALTIGLRDYVTKNGFQSVVLGLSGGIDSALVAAIARDAIGGENVLGISMPSKYSSRHSREDAQDLAARLGLAFRTVAIEPMLTAFHEVMDLSGLAEENLQARVRGVTLMALSNAEGHLVLATGNNTEIAVGYSTIYGDAVGGFAPIKDVSKTQVWALARWRNAQAAANGEVEPIPDSSITKPPSAELRPGQVDTDSLPEYDLLDRVLDAYVAQDQDADALVAQGFDAKLVQRIIAMTDRAEYKRRQYPPGTKISLKAFGRDRRLPITNQWRLDV
ncbi:MAG: NAD+ synthase [Actinomycetia bacterium]|nr:NAD+ synthase [Actinomycetes bacterium]